MPIPLRELTPEQRAAIARDYGDHAITVAAILARHDIHHRTLYGLVRAGDLPLRRAEIAAGADDPFAHGRRQPRPERLTDEALLARERELIDAATAVARRQIRALEVERVLGEGRARPARRRRASSPRRRARSASSAAARMTTSNARPSSSA